MPDDSDDSGLVDVYADSRPDPEWDDEANGVEISQDELNGDDENEGS